jgi:hypothetical protein
MHVACVTSDWTLHSRLLSSLVLTRVGKRWEAIYNVVCILLMVDIFVCRILLLPSI